MSLKYSFLFAVLGVVGFCHMSLAAYVDPTGNIEGRMKIYSESCDQSGVQYTHEQEDNGEVHLYDDSGDRVDSDDVDSSGEYKFEDIKAGEKYYIKCEADGYVSADDPDDDKYTSSKFELDADETVVENCDMLRDEDLQCTSPAVIVTPEPTPVPAVVPTCGSAQKTYQSDATAFAGNFCENGTVVKAPQFPEQGLEVEWSCVNNGEDVQCHASREEIASIVKGESKPVVTPTPEPPKSTPEPTEPVKAKKPVEPTPTSYQAVSTVGLATGTAIAFATSAVPLFATMPMAAKDVFLMPFLGLLARRRNEKNWGTVFEKTTKQPIPGVKLTLVGADGNEIETAYSDQYGRYGFLTTSGTYLIQPQKSKYQESYEHEVDPLYGETYTGEQITMDENKVLIPNIAMQAIGVDWAAYAQKKTEVYEGWFSVFKKWSFIIVFYAGFVATAVITYFYPSMINFIFLALYTALFVYDNFFKKKKYGTVQTEGEKPVPFAIVSLHNQETNEKKSFAVTDVIGRYYLLAENGLYNMKVKGQPVGGHNFEKQGEVHVREGFLRNDLHV